MIKLRIVCGIFALSSAGYVFAASGVQESVVHFEVRPRNGESIGYLLRWTPEKVWINGRLLSPDVRLLYSSEIQLTLSQEVGLNQSNSACDSGVYLHRRDGQKGVQIEKGCMQGKRFIALMSAFRRLAN